MELKNLLLNNYSTNQTIFKNALWLFIGKGVGFLELLLVILVARTLGPTEYGKFSFAWSLVSMFAAVAIFGLPEIINREFSRREDLRIEFPSILSLRAILSAGAFAAVFGTSFLVTQNLQIRTVVWILAGYALLRGFGETVFAVFRARQRMEYEAWMQALFTLSFFVFVGLAIIFSPSIIQIGIGYFTGALASLLGVFVFFGVKIGTLRIGWERDVWKKFFSFSWPLGLTAVFASVYMSADSVIMGVLGQTTQVGWYNAAYRIVNIAVVPMTVISLSFYPVLSRYRGKSGDLFREVWVRFFKIMLAVGTLLAASVVVLAPQIIGIAYGPGYAPSVLALRILMIMVWIWFLVTPFIRALVIFDLQKIVLLVSALGALVNLILNMILIPAYSLYGAAIATVSTYMIVLVLSALFVYSKMVTKNRTSRSVGIR